MSDHDTWNMFAAAAYAAWMETGECNAEDCRLLAAEDADWFLAESKKREPAEPTPPQHDDDGWIKWEGGECPVDDDTDVKVRLRNGAVLTNAAGEFYWRWAAPNGGGNIVAYRRIVSEAGVTK